MTTVSLKQLYFMSLDRINENPNDSYAKAVVEYIGVVIQGDTRDWDAEYNSIKMLAALDELA